MSETEQPPKALQDDPQKAWVATNAPSLKKWADSVRSISDGMPKPAAAAVPRK